MLRFGDCSLDIAARELRRDGVRVDLPPLVFDCIAYLVTHRDRAVGRDELVAAVWGKAAISDTMLGKAILAARRAVGDSAEQQALLRTVPRFGYHWVGAVQEQAAGEALPEAVPPLATTPAPARRRGVSQPALTILVTTLLALVALAAAWWLRPAPPAAPDTTATQADAPLSGTLAVLPTEVFADPGDDWLRLGLMDLLATRLRTAGLAVVPSEVVVRAVGTERSSDRATAAVRTAIDVGDWVVPAVRKAGGEWIVRAELRRAGGRRSSVQAQAANPVAAADAVARRLLALLGRAAADERGDADVDLTELLQRTDAARLAENLDLARSVIANAPASLRASPEVRERAIRIDLRAGEFDRARAAIQALLEEVPAEADPVMHARLQENLCVAQMRLGRPQPALDACNRSIELLETRNEPRALGRAYNNRGILHARQNQIDAAIADFARSRVALNLADDPLLLAQLDGNESTVEMSRGRPAEALPTLERAGRTFQRFGMINEFVTALVNQIHAHLMLLQPLEALQASDAGWSERTRITDPEVRGTFERDRAEVLAANGRLNEARLVLDALLHSAGPAPGARQLAPIRAAQAEVERAGGQPAAAALLARQALDGLDSGEETHERARAWLLLVRALRESGDDAGAAAESARFVAWSRPDQPPRARLFATLAEAESAAAAHRDEAAVTAYEAATTIAAGTSADGAAEVADSFAGYLIARGQLARAAVVAGPLARYADHNFEAAVVGARLYQALGQPAAWQKALAQARRLAGERPLPAQLEVPPPTPPAPVAQSG
ncbi:winged helix-turn-helix domain-containing protein [Dokdonella sp.]|uniref:winged helix-turn-helix domain-containing protein n=1 Tax=Dokdonella sp. TaxID=2291710 RepID=UPI001B1651AC|nr:winged helix-turn-helix domain-containing protein [Dokdonella sp.]MBO9664382.1 winged helix-turn-helix domain-containing protein [Dokdonella sp.]